MRPRIEKVDDWIILEVYRGSISHGTYIPSGDSAIDDKDTMGIAIPPIDYYFGLKSFEQKELKVGEWDVLIYEIKKFFRLLMKGNPNVLSLLWTEKNHIIKNTEIGQRLIDSRDIFLSTECYKSFCGYAYGQLKRMTHINAEMYKSGYLGAKRRALVEKFGYDVKNAQHLIRLLRMGIELLKTGHLNVMRPDNNYLIEIKQGKYSLDHIEKEADRLFKLLDETLVKSVLPNKLDEGKINKLLIDIINKRSKE